ncbi:Insulinoma-associated protein 1 [Trichinella pseudospiralis]|uniref:Insulinoma-associated protein 1 n=1 Tax=Trichinella pseudospiralis TaxID=6337 RepID=A0A0V1IRY7_TRIPS|nr:Insulinoma-associated protein 1 [Trichinella pseudospiralis]
MADASREFLVHRFVEDSRRRQYPNGTDGKVCSSDSEEQSECGSDKAPPNVQIPAMGPFPFGVPFPNSLQLAATLASLGQIGVLQPNSNGAAAAAAAACALPFLYPHLCQSLLALPNMGLLQENPLQVQDVPVTPKASPEPQIPVKVNPAPSPRKRSATKVNRGCQADNNAKSNNGSSSNNNNNSNKNNTNGENVTKKQRTVRRLQVDEETTSPVSGMYIRDANDVPPELLNKNGTSTEELEDETALWVEASEEARAELALIPNRIGDYICRLCKVRYEDAFRLARHRCPRIAHQEYRCPECSKVFSCPANLASHRRWHRPKDKVSPPENVVQNTIESPSVSKPVEDDIAVAEMTAFSTNYECELCGKRFDSHRLLRNHAIRHTNFAILPTDGQDDQECQCTEPGCELWFPAKDLLEKHRSAAHPASRTEKV